MIWMPKAQQIRRQNMKVNAVAGKLYSMLKEDGLRCCILKGQGNALMYPNPYSCTPGDIAIPTSAFNVVYQLTHLYHHFFDEGIGMRQIIDYFLLVCDFYKVYQNSSKITPSLFTIKEGSTSHPDPLTLRGEGGNRPTRCSEPLRSKDGGASKPSPNCAGWDRLGIAVYSLQLIVYSLRLISWLFDDKLQISC